MLSAYIYAVQTIVLLYALFRYWQKQDMLSLILIVCDLLSIVLVYFQYYDEYPWTKEIYKCAPVDYSATGYNEGEYYGGWEDEYPQGFGRLTYRHFIDGKYYTIEDDEGEIHRALYYEGEFDHGWRVGQGTVVYEGGFRDVGTFYGRWEPGKTVFVGTRWQNDDRCLNLEIVAINGVDAYENRDPEGWIVVGD